MTDQRRPARGRRTPGARGPGRVGRSRPAARGRGREAAAARGVAVRRRPRLTGRAAILVLVVAVLAVSYASSLRAYLQQRAHIDDLQSQIAERQDAIDALEVEKERWSDPAYVQAQARERFGYVMPGETPFVVVDQDGQALDPDDRLSDPDGVGEEPPRAWYDDVWDSTRLAGNPPKKAPAPPRTLIDGADDPGSGGSER